MTEMAFLHPKANCVNLARRIPDLHEVYPPKISIFSDSKFLPFSLNKTFGFSFFLNSRARFNPEKSFFALLDARKRYIFEIHCASNRAEGSDDASAESTDPLSLLLQLEQLQKQLDLAVRSEDYAYAARLRDRLKQLQDDTEVSVLAANSRFYRAFESGDMNSMRRIWVKGDHVQCIHPRLNCIAGFDQVMESWELILGSARNFRITLEEVRVHVSENLAFVTCVEVVRAPGSSGRIVATNVFEKHGEEWLICLHHGSPVSSLPFQA